MEIVHGSHKNNKDLFQMVQLKIKPGPGEL
jgi:hypothetical protein